jgi:hypothetical protein
MDTGQIEVDLPELAIDLGSAARGRDVGFTVPEGQRSRETTIYCSSNQPLLWSPVLNQVATCRLEPLYPRSRPRPRSARAPFVADTPSPTMPRDALYPA